MTDLEPFDIVLGIALSVLVIGWWSQHAQPAQAETPSRFHVWRVEHNGPLSFNLVHDAADGRCYVVTSVAVRGRLMGTGSLAMALSRDDVREQLRATVDGRMSVEQLEDWLVAHSWNLHLTDTPRDVQDLLRAIDHDLATRVTNVAAVAQLQRRLQRLDARPGDARAGRRQLRAGAMPAMIRRRTYMTAKTSQSATAKARTALHQRLFAVVARYEDGTLRRPTLVDAGAVLTIRLPHRLESPNAWLWSHWRTKKKAKDAWATRLFLAVIPSGTIAAHVGKVAEIIPAWTAPTNRPTVRIARQVPSRRNFITDRENRFFAAKALVDCLVQAGFLTNDREKDINLQVWQEVSADGLDWTEVVIDARAPEHRTEARD